MDAGIKELQTILTFYLESYIQLLDETNNVLYQSTNMDDTTPVQKAVDYDGSIDRIKRKIDDVLLFQIRVPIVAPMKAGKSTMINALIGDDVLPTRLDAMTTLPTTVILKLGETYDINMPAVELVLHDKTLNAIRTLQSEVIEKLKMDFTDDNQLDKLLLKNPHLTSTAKDLRDKVETPIELQTKITDTKQIRSILTFINDLVRISIKLSLRQPTSSLSLGEFRDHIPIINVHNCPIQNTEHKLNHHCQVLFIDTPGPDEAGASGKLFDILKNELQRADMVLAVIEYSHINTETGKVIADYIEKMREMKNNQDCIYVLISKADQYKRKDMTEEELSGHVARLFNVSEDRVFELSGQYALIAQKFLDIYQKSQLDKSEIIVESCEMAKDVLEAYCPADWKKRLKKETATKVAEKAEVLYESSGLGEFLNTAIGTVLSQVVRRCIESATDTCTNINTDVLNDVTIRLNGLEVFEEKLYKEIDDLNQDLEYLSNMRKTYVSDLDQITSMLEIKLKSIFQQISNECQQQVKSIFDPNGSQWRNPEAEAQQAEKDQREVIVTMGTVAMGAMTIGKTAAHVAGPTAGVIGIITGAVLVSVTTKEIMRLIHGRENEIPFDDAKSAQKFLDNVTGELNKTSKNIYSTIDESIRRTCNEVSKEFYARQREQTNAILERANARLNATFNIQLITPRQLQLEYQDVNFNINEIGRIETSWLYTIYSRLTNRENKCFLSGLNLEEACQKTMKEHLERIRKNIVEKTIKEMKQKIISHFRELHDYMEKYKRYAQFCLSDKLLDKENKAVFKAKLQKLKGEWIIKQQEIKELIENIDWDQISKPT